MNLVNLREARAPAALFSNGLGDHLLNLPALRALGELFAGRLSLICQPHACASFFADVDLRAVAEVEMRYSPEEHAMRFDHVDVAERLSSCDLFLSMVPWDGSSVASLRQAWGNPPSIGYHEGFEHVLPRHASVHSADLGFMLPRLFDASLEVERFAAPPQISASDAAAAETYLGRLRSQGGRLLSVHADSDERRKDWPSARFVALLEQLLERLPLLQVVIVGFDGLSDHVDLDPRVQWHRGGTVGEAMAVVAGTDAFVGVDSLFLHVSDLFAVPGVGIFGPTDPLEWGYRFSPGLCVGGDCAIDDVDVDTVLHAVLSLPPFAQPLSQRSSA